LNHHSLVRETGHFIINLKLLSIYFVVGELKFDLIDFS